MHWLIVEDALRDTRGHWLEYVSMFVNDLRKLGDTVTILAPRDAQPVVFGTLDVKPVLPRSIWHRMNDGSGPLVRLARIPLHSRATFHVMQKYFKRHGFPDLIFVPTVAVHHLAAWHHLLNGPLRCEKSRVLLYFLDTPIRFDAASGGAELLPNWTAKYFLRLVRSLESAVQRGQLLLGTETQAMAQGLQKVTGVPFVCLPQPVNKTAGIGKHPSVEGEFQMASYGPARHEKGSDILQSAIALYLRERPQTRTRFILQWAEDFRDQHGVWITKYPELVTHSRMTYITRHITGSEYSRHLKRADAMLLPYRMSYILRGSRVALEAIIHGIPMITTRGTTLAQHMEQFGAGVLCEDGSVESLCEAIRQMEDNYDSLLEKASARAEAASMHFSVKNFRKLVNDNLFPRPSVETTTDEEVMPVEMHHSELREHTFSQTAETSGPFPIISSRDLLPSEIAIGSTGVQDRDSGGDDRIGHSGSSKPLRILLKGWYGQGNLGDDLLLLKMLECIPPVHQLSVVGEEEGLGKIFPKGRIAEFIPTSKKHRDFANAYLHADLLVIGGGGLFPYVCGHIKRYFDLVLATLTLKKLVIMGVGINPHKSGLEKWIWSYLSKRAAFLSVRDSYSAGFLRGGVGDSCEIPMLHDLYLAGGISGRETKCLVNFHKPVALVCPAGFSQGAYNRFGLLQAARYDALVDELASAVRVLIKNGLEPVLVSIFPREDSDMVDDIDARYGLGHLTKLEYMRDFQADEAGALFRGASFCICMRFHSIVLAAQNFRNLVAICYDYKSLSLLKSLDMESAGVSYGIGKNICFGEELDLIPGQLATMVEEALPNRESVERHLVERMPVLEREARVNFSTLTEIMRSMSEGAAAGNQS